MRRGLASLIMGLSLIVATLSWAGFTLSRTILDPGSSERLADRLLDNDAVRDALVNRITDELANRLFETVPVPPGVIEASAEQVVDDPRVEEILKQGIVQAHRNALTGENQPIVLDSEVLSEVGRDRLLSQSPEIADELLPSGRVEVELPTAGISWLARLKDFVDRWTVIGAVIAAAGAALAFLVARERHRVLRRVAWWAIGVAGFWLLVGYLLPWLAGLVSPTSGAVAAAMIDVFFSAMIPPAVTMAGFGATMFVASLLWPMFSTRRGAAVLQPSGPRSVRRAGPGPVPGALGPADRGPVPTVPTSSMRPTSQPVQAAQPPAQTTQPYHGPRPTPSPGVPVPPPGPGPASIPVPPPAAATHQPPPRTEQWPQQGSNDPTGIMPNPLGPNPTPADSIDIRDDRPTAVWQPGQGYTDEQTTRKVDSQATTRWDGDAADDPAGADQPN